MRFRAKFWDVIFLSISLLSFSLVGLSWQEEFALRCRENGVELSARPRHLLARFESVLFSFYQLNKDSAWVNLNYKLDEEKVLPPEFRGTPIGKILLETDLQLKRDAKAILEDIFPDEFYQAESDLRMWIELEDAVLSDYKNDWQVVKKARLKVKAEGVGLDESVLKEISQRLTELVNTSPEYQDLRLLVSACILAPRIEGNYGINPIGLDRNWSVRRRFEQYLDEVNGEGIGGVDVNGKKAREENDDDEYNPHGRDQLDPFPSWAGEVLNLFLRNGKDVVLVSDMDYTLLANGPVSDEVAGAIAEFTNRGHKFVVLTGSGLEKTKKYFIQPFLDYLSDFDEITRKRVLKNLIILTENGAQVYSFDETLSLKLVKETTLSEMVGEKLPALREFLGKLESNYADVRAGSFVLVRESSIVVCPWGYGFRKEERQSLFEEFPEERRNTLRQELARKINEYLRSEGIPLIAKVAGNFSIDIIPAEGKEWGIRELEELFGTKRNQIIFLGDGFGPGENDETVLGKVALAINVGRSKRDGTIFVGRGPEGSKEVIETIVRVSERYDDIKSEHIALFREEIKDGRLVYVLKELSHLDEGFRREVLRSLLPDIKNFLKDREDDVERYLSLLRDRAFGLQPFEVILVGGGSSVRYLWKDVLLGWGEPSCAYLTHNLDDGGSSLSIMQRLFQKGYRLVFPPGDLANALAGFLGSWRGRLLGDDARVDGKEFFLGSLNILCESISQDKAEVLELDEEDISRLLYLFLFVEEEHPELLESRSVSLRNVLLLSTLFKLGYPKDADELQDGLDAFSQLLSAKDKRISLVNTDLYTMYVKREGWTVRVRGEGKEVVFGIRKRNDRWELVRYSQGKLEILYPGEKGVEVDGVKVRVVKGQVILDEKVILAQLGFDAYIILDGKRIDLSRDGRGTFRHLEGTEKEEPVYSREGKEVFIAPDVEVMQTNITETFSPLRIKESGLLDIPSRNPVEVFRQAEQGKVLEGLVPGDSLEFALEGDGPIIIGPGSFFTSIMPFFKTKSFVNLLVEAKKRGRKVILVLGAGEDNETFGLGIEDLLEFIEKETGKKLEELIDGLVYPEEESARDIHLPIMGLTGEGLRTGLYGPSFSGKAIYSVLSFSSPQKKEFWARRLELIGVKVKTAERPSRIKGKKLVRVYYSTDDLREKLSNYLGMRPIPIFWKQIEKLKKQAEEVFEKFQAWEEGGLFLLNEMLEGLLSGEMRLSEVTSEGKDLPQILLTGNWEAVKSMLFYQEEDFVDEVVRKIREVDVEAEHKGISLGNRLIAVGSVLSEYNLTSVAKKFIGRGIFEVLRENENLNIDWVPKHLIEINSKFTEKEPEELGGVLLTI